MLTARDAQGLTSTNYFETTRNGMKWYAWELITLIRLQTENQILRQFTLLPDTFSRAYHTLLQKTRRKQFEKATRRL